MSPASKPTELMFLKMFVLLKPGDDKVFVTLELFLVTMSCLIKRNHVVCDDLVNTVRMLNCSEWFFSWFGFLDTTFFFPIFQSDIF